ncbi:uncharacterized protein [Canis lupus baileyi]|uniref:uncharacterized protein n=1 Tax=Canis lupus baileyi TaxID=143281 RepID=UPI003B971E00
MAAQEEFKRALQPAFRVGLSCGERGLWGPLPPPAHARTPIRVYGAPKRPAPGHPPSPAPPPGPSPSGCSRTSGSSRFRPAAGRPLRARDAPSPPHRPERARREAVGVASHPGAPRVAAGRPPALTPVPEPPGRRRHPRSVDALRRGEAAPPTPLAGALRAAPGPLARRPRPLTWAAPRLGRRRWSRRPVLRGACAARARRPGLTRGLGVQRPPSRGPGRLAGRRGAPGAALTWLLQWPRPPPPPGASSALRNLLRYPFLWKLCDASWEDRGSLLRIRRHHVLQHFVLKITWTEELNQHIREQSPLTSLDSRLF